MGFLSDGCVYQFRTANRGSSIPRMDLTSFVTDHRWGRVLSDTSTAKLTLTKSAATGTCCTQLVDMRTAEQDLVIVRGTAEVWRGPMDTIVEKRETVEVTAKDPSVWFREWRAPSLPVVVENLELAEVWSRVVTAALNGDQAGLSPVPRPADTGVLAARTMEPLRALTTTHLDELSRTGIPWTVVGGQVLVDQRTVAPVLLTEEAFTSDISIVEDANPWGSRVTQNGDGTLQAPVSGANPAGVIKDIVLADRTIIDAPSATWSAQRYLDNIGGDRPPIVVAVPNGAGLATDAAVDIGQLVPGRRFTVRLSSGYCRSGFVSTAFTLSAVEVKRQKAGVDLVAVSFIPEVIR